MSRASIPINKNILKELEAKHPQKWIIALEKFKWLQEDKFPTFNQLKKASKFFGIPFGYFFLNQLPKYTYPFPHYRTQNDTAFIPSQNLIDTIKDVSRKQEWIKSILRDWGYKSLYFAGKYSVGDNVKNIAQEIKKILQIEKNWAEGVPNWANAFRFLVDKIENSGVFVVVNGVVGNNTHRKLDVNEFRGFVLYDKIAPFIFVNNNDAITGKIFTLIHEFVHILVGKSASFDLRDLQPAKDIIEEFCNICAAEFLVPAKDLEIAYNEGITDPYELAKKFKVSSIVIARRLLDLGFIDKTNFFEFYNTHIQKEFKMPHKTSGGNFYNVVGQRSSKRFLRIMITAFKSGDILYTDFYNILKLKPKTADKVIQLYGE